MSERDGKTQIVIGRPVGIPLSETQGALVLRWLDSDGVMEALWALRPATPNPAAEALVQRFEDALYRQIAAGGTSVEGLATARGDLMRALTGSEAPLSLPLSSPLLVWVPNPDPEQGGKVINWEATRLAVQEAEEAEQRKGTIGWMGLLPHEEP